ncbi:MAG: type II secretion system F family protein, partial [Patescibacteria group bacterium]
MKFNYQARTQDGEVQSGIVEASTAESAIALLQRQGLFVTILEGIKTSPTYAKKIELFPSISNKDIVMFSRQLSIMFKSNVSLVEGLRVLSVQTENSDFQERIRDISGEIEAGTPFSEALSKHPKLFSPFYIAMIKSGEASGKLSGSLNYLAEHLEREYHMNGKVKGAMIYPALIFLFMIIVIFAMVFFVIPNLTQVLKETGKELPLVTKIVLASTDFLKQWFGPLSILTLVGIGSFLKYSKTDVGKKNIDEIILTIPMFGDFLKKVYISRFAENLSTLIGGGLPIARALEITAEIVGNEAYKKVIFDAQDMVRRGETISSALQKAPHIFSPMFIQMVQVGEKTGTLDKSLMDVVTFYQKETERA